MGGQVGPLLGPCMQTTTATGSLTVHEDVTPIEREFTGHCHCRGRARGPRSAPTLQLLELTERGAAADATMTTSENC